MNKLFKLIYINLLDLFDINKIIIAREDGVKSNLEKRLVITCLISLFYGYLVYMFLTNLNFSNTYLILSIGFVFATILCFVNDLSNVESAIFKNADNDILFSFPITRYQILFSKLFVVYIRNLLFVAIIMVASFLAFYNSGADVTDTMVLMYILGSLIIPLVPIVFATIISYFKDYFKVKYNNSFGYKLVKNLLIILVFVLIYLLFSDVKIDDVNTGIVNLINRVNYVVPLNYLFYSAIKNENIFSFIGLIVIPIIITYLYMFFINNNYLKICSKLKGVNKKEKFVYKKSNNFGRFWGMVKKEFIYLFKNKQYLFSSFGISLIFTVILFLLLSLINIDSLYTIEKMSDYIDLYLPTIFAMLVTLSCSTIVAMSLERSNMQILRTMPISIGKILTSKWFVNVIVGSVFVVINGSIVWYFLDYDVWNVVFTYLLPFVALLFVSLTGLVLDYRFIENNEYAIVKQRLVTMVPTFLSVFIGIFPFSITLYFDYRYVLGSYMLAMIIGIVIEIVYLIVNKKKLLKGLFN